jgi:hypothetical protein
MGVVGKGIVKEREREIVVYSNVISFSHFKNHTR